MNADKALPRARTNDLEIQDLEGETLIYDRKRHQAHCMNRLAALVWLHCNGRTTHAEMARILHRDLGVPEDMHLVEAALEDLHEAGMLCGPMDRKPTFSRRELAIRLGAVATAFLLAPMVASVRAQQPATQASPRPTTTPPPN